MTTEEILAEIGEEHGKDRLNKVVGRPTDRAQELWGILRARMMDDPELYEHVCKVLTGAVAVARALNPNLTTDLMTCDMST